MPSTQRCMCLRLTRVPGAMDPRECHLDPLLPGVSPSVADKHIRIFSSAWESRTGRWVARGTMVRRSNGLSTARLTKCLQGSRLIGRYMIPQAKRYKHTHAVVQQPAWNRPPPQRFGSGDSTVSAASSVVLGANDLTPIGEEGTRSKGKEDFREPEPRAESDALVIFVRLPLSTHLHSRS